MQRRIVQMQAQTQCFFSFNGTITDADELAACVGVVQELIRKRHAIVGVTVRNVLLVIRAERIGKLQHEKAGSTRMTTTIVGIVAAQCGQAFLIERNRERAAHILARIAETAIAQRHAKPVFPCGQAQFQIGRIAHVILPWWHRICSGFFGHQRLDFGQRWARMIVGKHRCWRQTSGRITNDDIIARIVELHPEAR